MDDKTKNPNQMGRVALEHWDQTIHQDVYSTDDDFIHTIRYAFPNDFSRINSELEIFGNRVTSELEPLVMENHVDHNLPRLEPYDNLGNRIDRVVHHPTYAEIGDIIYSSNLMSKIANPGGLLEGLSLFFISSQAGEAGHHCPIACSAGIMRVLQLTPNFPNREYYLKKFISNSYQTNYTGAQFLTEIQGGSDVGLNAVYAKKEKNTIWKIFGEKWFCSNADADLIFITARYDDNIAGTKGLALFLIPSKWNEEKNHYTIRRLKDKLGTKTMATAEIDFNGAFAYPIGDLSTSFNLVMDNVLHLSRLFNSFCVLGMARRAYSIALTYAKYRIAFSHAIIQYPLVKETLAKIKSENTAMIAGIFETTRLQDKFDTSKKQDEKLKLLLRLLVNIQKYLSAKLSVEHIHDALGILAGNGTIETFSSLPRLLRDCIVCENWEGTHNVLRAQVLKDIVKFEIDKLFISYIQEEMKKLPQSKHLKILSDNLKNLEENLILLKNSSKELQSLKIKHIVDQMGILFCALRLLFEAHDQEMSGSSSKLDCFQYLVSLHIQPSFPYDENYLTIISRIIDQTPSQL